MRIVPFSEERRTELFALLRACLGEKATVRRDELFWGWKHERNPFGQSLLLLGEEDGRLVGLRAFLRWQWQSGKKRFAAVRAVDTATHPDQQRKGIFSQLTLAGLDVAGEEGVNFVFNTPNESSMPGYLKMGWRHVARLPMQIKVLRPLRFAAGLINARLLHRPVTATGEEAEVFLGQPLIMSDFLAQARGIEELVARDLALRGSGLTTVRSPGFLLWRYAQHPYVTYHAEVDDSLRGVLIWRTSSRFGLREIMLCDLLIADADPTIVAGLVSGLCRRVKADYLVAHFGPQSAHHALLRRCGFFTLPGQGMNFTVRGLGRDIDPDPYQRQNWSLCLGDLEIF